MFKLQFWQNRCPTIHKANLDNFQLTAFANFANFGPSLHLFSLLTTVMTVVRKDVGMGHLPCLHTFWCAISFNYTHGQTNVTVQ